jgi:CHAT domain-containing protein
MSDYDLSAQLLALPDDAAQRQLLQEHVSLLDDEVAAALKGQADRFLRSDLSRSSQTAELLFYMAELVDNPLYRALGLLAEANVRAIGLGEYQRALELYDRAAEIYQANGCAARQARSQIGKLVALSRLGRYAEAIKVGEWASRVLEAHAQWRPLADLTLNLGVVHSRQGEDTESLAWYDRARELYERLGAEGEPFLPWIDQDRAVALRNLGQFEASLQAARRAEETMARLGQRIEAARAQQNQALTYFALGRYNEALDLYDQVRGVFLADGRQRDAILVELYASDCLLQLRRLADVLERCHQIRRRFTELGARLEAAQALLNEATAYTGLRRHAEAMASLMGARRLFAQEGNQVWIACTDLETAALLLRQGEAETSLATARACARVFRTYGLSVKEAQAHLIAARAATALGQHGEAQRMVTETLAVAESRDIPPLTYQGHHLLGALAMAEGNARKAMAEYDRAVLELERLRGRLMIEFRADFLEDKQAVYEDMVRLLLDAGHPLQALEYVERAKSRALLDLLAYRLDLGIRARSAADRPLVEKLVRLRVDRDRLYRRWSYPEELEEENWTVADESRQRARQEVLALEKQITELWHRLLVRNADYACDASLWQVRAEPIQPYLAPKTALLEYYAVGQRLVAFLVASDAIQVQWLPGDIAQMRRLVRLFWLNLKAVPKSAPDQVRGLSVNAHGLLQQLHKRLVAPLGDALVPYKRLIIVPHGPLHYLPFHALYDGTSFLLEEHEISYLPAASLLRYCHRAEASVSGQLVYGHSHAGRLPYAVEEARAIAELMNARAFLEGDATLARLREDAPDCRVIHLATHGAFRADNPLFSGLALADGWLSTLDVFDLRLAASLVVLSACQTGRNVVGGGDELLGLMRAFLYAGAASVLLSLWAVEDRSAAGLMEIFYRKLVEGWTKGDALRYAQRQFLEGQETGDRGTVGTHTHPYYWAPLFLVGDARTL